MECDVIEVSVTCEKGFRPHHGHCHEKSYPPLPFDVLGQLDAILTELRDKEKLHSSCRDPQIQRIELIREEVEAGLANHFTSAIDLRLRTSVG